MKYAGIIKNDVAAAPGVCVTFYTQGCPHHCPGCHNPETWDFNGGKEFTPQTLQEIKDALVANGIHRDFCGTLFVKFISLTQLSIQQYGPVILMKNYLTEMKKYCRIYQKVQIYWLMDPLYWQNEILHFPCAVPAIKELLS